jgi:ABC-type uncharacterized transport system ATPase subunit
MTQLIKDIIQEERRNGATVFLTTHNMFVAEAFLSVVLGLAVLYALTVHFLIPADITTNRF